MISQYASQFADVPVASAFLVLFLVIFTGIIAWVLRRGSQQQYAQIAALPLDGESHHE